MSFSVTSTHSVPRHFFPPFFLWTRWTHMTNYFILYIKQNQTVQRTACASACDCALNFDGVRGCFCLEMWNASSMCMFKATLREFPPSLYICVLWILKVQYPSVLGVLIWSRTTQAWEDGSQLRHRAKKISPLPQAPSSWCAATFSAFKAAQHPGEGPHSPTRQHL